MLKYLPPNILVILVRAFLCTHVQTVKITLRQPPISLRHDVHAAVPTQPLLLNTAAQSAVVENLLRKTVLNKSAIRLPSRVGSTSAIDLLFQLLLRISRQLVHEIQQYEIQIVRVGETLCQLFTCARYRFITVLIEGKKRLDNTRPDHCSVDHILYLLLFVYVRAPCAQQKNRTKIQKNLHICKKKCNFAQFFLINYKKDGKSKG